MSPFILWPAVPPYDNRCVMNTIGMATGKGKPYHLKKKLFQCHSKKMKTNGLSYSIANFSSKKLKSNCLNYGGANNGCKKLRTELCYSQL